MKDEQQLLAKIREQSEHLLDFFRSEDPACQEDIDWVKSSLGSMLHRIKELQDISQAR